MFTLLMRNLKVLFRLLFGIDLFRIIDLKKEEIFSML